MVICGCNQLLGSGRAQAEQHQLMKTNSKLKQPKKVKTTLKIKKISKITFLNFIAVTGANKDESQKVLKQHPCVTLIYVPQSVNIKYCNCEINYLMILILDTQIYPGYVRSCWSIITTHPFNKITHFDFGTEY